MNPKIKFWMVYAVGILVLFAIVTGGFLIFPEQLPVAEKKRVLSFLNDHFQMLFVFPALTIFFLSLLSALWLYRHHFLPLNRIIDETVILAEAHPEHRLGTNDNPQLQRLTESINSLGRKCLDLRENVARQIRLATMKTIEQRNHLAALIEQLAEGILVCNCHSRVLLYNERARELLIPPGNELTAGRHYFLGLGRPLDEIIDPDVLRRGYAELIRRRSKYGPDPVFEFTTPGAGGRLLRIRLIGIQENGDEISGYILVIYDLSRGTQSDAGHTVSRQTNRPILTESRPLFYDFDLFHQPGQSRQTDDLPLERLSYTVFDTETTGLNPSEGDEIISIGAVRIVNGRLLPGDTFDQLVDPRRPISKTVIAITGIQPAQLRGKPTIERVLPAFHTFAGNTVLVAHNAAFDMRFLKIKEPLAGVRFIHPVLDTLLLSAVLHPDHERHNLDDIARRLGIRLNGRHTALGDARATAEIFLKLIPLLRQKGIRTLKEAREASANTFYAKIRY